MNELRATELTIRYEAMYLNGTQEEKAAVEQEIASLRTPKWKLRNAGLTICLTAAVLLSAIRRFRLWDIRMLRHATTPQTRLGLLGLAGVAWFTLLPAFLLALEDDYAQDDLTPTIDTGHGLAYVDGPPFFAIALAVLSVLGRYVVLRSARLPSNLWIRDAGRPHRSLIWTTLYGLLAGVIVILIAGAAMGSPWFLPSLAIGLYVVLSTRAAVLNGGRPQLATPA
jgi:hypothetical protein